MKALLVALALFVSGAADGATLPRPADLEAPGARVHAERFKGRPALRVTAEDLAGNGLALLPQTDFQDGAIELEVAGEVAPGADAGARGFVGVAFRVQPGGKAFELFYLRPTNGRADDQLRRNHALQYVSAPDFPWERLRKDTPGQYEAYADLQPGAWTRMRIVVHGTRPGSTSTAHAGRP
jgi:hypothetical protein